MKLASLFSTVVSAVSLCFAVPSVRAATLPITFESPTYTAAGLASQEGWGLMSGSGGSTTDIAVTTTSPIAGLQSLRVNNDSNSSGGSNQRKALVSSIGTAPTNMSWLVRVDTLGNNVNAGLTTADTGIQIGLSNLSVAGSIPVGVAFRDNGTLGYISPDTAAGFKAFSGSNTYNTGTVYRVEFLNINTTANTYDIKVLLNSDDSLIAQALGVSAVNSVFANSVVSPAAGAIGTGNVGVYVARRGGTTGDASVDNITIIPEPNSIILIGIGGLSIAGCMYRRRRMHALCK